VCCPLAAWRQQYNADRPHQSLAMAFPGLPVRRRLATAEHLNPPAYLFRTARCTMALLDGFVPVTQERPAGF
jgi:hypothetical protein